MKVLSQYIFVFSLYFVLTISRATYQQNENWHRGSIKQRRSKVVQYSRHSRRLHEHGQAEQRFHIAVVECSEVPLFFCSACGSSPAEQFECNSCRQNVQLQQDQVFEKIVSQYPEISMVASTGRLKNAIFIRIPSTYDSNNVHSFIGTIDGVEKLSPHEELEANMNSTVEYYGVLQSQGDFCLTGQGVRVAVIDTGIDYTHEALGGEGTAEAYIAAYGVGLQAEQSATRDGLFPTDVVVDGYDFLGELYDANTPEVAVTPDDDPIDGNGHGTMVASAILAVAPAIELIALKACTLQGVCPGFAILQALEYALDPNGDGSTADKVDVVNLSLGEKFLSPYYSSVASLLETMSSLGVLPVIASGNNGDIPYILGPAAASPNVISVGGTGHPLETDAGVVGSYSSRGPGEINMLKPDIAAPGKLTLAAVGTGNGYSIATGTSAAAPIVAGAAALVKERCPECSVFALKALLMNNAFRGLRYNVSSEEGAPVTLVGAGEVRVNHSLHADFWAYSLQDVQPSISLGMIDAASDMVMRRTIQVMGVSPSPQTFLISSSFVNEMQESVGAVRVEIQKNLLSLTANCSDLQFEVEFHIDASKAPPNFMSSAGPLGLDSSGMNKNEFGGHILVQSLETSKEISLPFHMLIRQAANITINNTVLSGYEGGPRDIPVGIVNHGAGLAQIDFFELLLVSLDDPEGQFGEPIVPSDIRFGGYRVRTINVPGCVYVFEFVFTTWESKTRILQESFEVDIKVGEAHFSLYSSQALDGEISCLLYDYSTDEVQCTGLAPDHSTNTANTVLRVCSDDLGITEPGSMNVSFSTSTRLEDSDDEIITDSSGNFSLYIDYPDEWVSAPSYDVYPGAELNSITVNGTRASTLGLIMITNSYRSPDSTGASTSGTETVPLISDLVASFNINLPPEVTPDVLEMPKAKDLTGPSCSWSTDSCIFEEGLTSPPTALEAASNASNAAIPSIASVPSSAQAGRIVRTTRQGRNCSLFDLPRQVVFIVSPAPTRLPSISPSTMPSQLPSESSLPSLRPTSMPSKLPSKLPTSSPSEVPTKTLSEAPSLTPTYLPSDRPSLQPSSVPSSFPSSVPSYTPSDTPSTVPSKAPSMQPSKTPSPTSLPSTSSARISFFVDRLQQACLLFVVIFLNA